MLEHADDHLGQRLPENYVLVGIEVDSINATRGGYRPGVEYRTLQ